MKTGRAPRIVVGIVAAALLAESLHVLGPGQIFKAVARVGWGFAVILLLSGVRDVVRTFAWTRAVGETESLRFWPALRARLAGEALNTLLPMGMVVGEPTKASQVSEELPFTRAFRALAVEFAFYTASLVPLFAAGVVAFALRNGITLGIPAVVFGVIGTAAMVAYVTRRGWLLAAGRPRQLGTIVACEIAYQILAIAETYYTLQLVSPAAPTVVSAIVLETVSRAVTMLFKMIPMRVGVDEASSSFIAGQVHLDPATGFALALVRKLRLLFWSGVGLALLVRRSASHAPLAPRNNRALARLAVVFVLAAAAGASAQGLSSTVSGTVSTAGSDATVLKERVAVDDFNSSGWRSRQTTTGDRAWRRCRRSLSFRVSSSR